jgi:hypothetical protein
MATVPDEQVRLYTAPTRSPENAQALRNEKMQQKRRKETRSVKTE